MELPLGACSGRPDDSSPRPGHQGRPLPSITRWPNHGRGHRHRPAGWHRQALFRLPPRRRQWSSTLRRPTGPREPRQPGARGPDYRVRPASTGDRPEAEGANDPPWVCSTGPSSANSVRVGVALRGSSRIETTLRRISCSGSMLLPVPRKSTFVRAVAVRLEPSKRSVVVALVRALLRAPNDFQSVCISSNRMTAS